MLQVPTTPSLPDAPLTRPDGPPARDRPHPAEPQHARRDDDAPAARPPTP